MLPKLYIGPVSRNTIAATIEVSKKLKVPLGLIPSRRQVDYNGGYVNYSTKQLFKLTKNEMIILERDHGGPNQGHLIDDGVISLIEDSKYFSIIHIDPFKKYKDLEQAAENTILHLNYLHKLNHHLNFEIGTEEGLRKYSIDELDWFVKFILERINKDIKIKYLVVQGGTIAKSATNVGIKNSEQLSNFISLCNNYGFLSKEHNGDYLSASDLKEKFALGLSAINIAPEFGSIESMLIYDTLSAEDQLLFFNLVVESKRWVKWFEPGFDPYSNIESLIKMCGHYVFENSSFKKMIKKYQLQKDLQRAIELKIMEIYENCSI